jgi:small subunit ribosomal protein S8
MVNDSLADLLTRIRNAQKAYHKTVMVPVSKVAAAVLGTLQKEGYIDSFDKEKAGAFEEYKVFLKYGEDGEPLIASLKRISTPGRRQYSRVKKLPKVNSGLGVCLVSTSQGIMTDREARKLGIGGEVLATVF